VIVVGGGFAGSTVAKYIRLSSGGKVAVTLVDRSPSHVSCVLSNLVLNGRMQLSELTIAHSKLGPYGVQNVQGQVTSIDPAARSVTVTLNDSTTTKLTDDRLILAMGIGFGAVPGKVVVLDANAGIPAEADTSNRAFTGIYKGIVSYIPNAALVSVDAASRKVNTSLGLSFAGGVVNILPPHQAPDAVMKSGLVPTGKLWAPVDPLTYESTLFPGVHVIGDTQATEQPRSAHMANSQAKVCADAIVRLWQGFDPLADLDRTANVTTNSACYSPITYSEASWLTANFAYGLAKDGKTYQMNPVQVGEAEKWDGENFEDMFTWASNLFTDSFT
jgi:hypothetical protein